MPLLPTSLVGSYPQPDWLIDRGMLSKRMPPRVRAGELWRVAPEWLDQAQDDATILAIRDQERAGLDILTDGEIRRESYSNRFATALDGVDLDNPGTITSRSGHSDPGATRGGKIRRRHPVQVRDIEFLRANTDRQIKITLPGPFTMSQLVENDFYKAEEEMALDYAAAVNEEIKDLFAAGADYVQIDEPYMQAYPDKARRYGLTAVNRALEGVKGTTAAAHLLRLRCARGWPAGRIFLPSRTQRMPRAADLDRDGAVETRLFGADEAAGQDDHPRCARFIDARSRDSGNGGGAHSPRSALHRAGESDRGAGLRAQVSAARCRIRQDEGHGGRRSARPQRSSVRVARSGLHRA